MEVFIQGKRISMSEQLESHIHLRAEKLERFYDRILSCQVTVVKERLAHRAEVVVHVPSHTLKTRHEAESALTAVDRTMDKVQRQLRKLSTKRRRVRIPGKEAVAPEER